VKLSIHPDAGAELVAAATFYRNFGGPKIGEAVVKTFEQACETLLNYPEFGVRSYSGARVLPLDRFPYSVVYRVRTSELLVIAFAHQRRRPNYWRHRS